MRKRLQELIAPYIVARDLKQVARRAGKPQQWLSSRLHGRAPIYADEIYLLAKGLNVDPCDFYRTEVEPGPTPSREDRNGHEPDYGDAIRRGALAKLDPEKLDLALKIVGLLEERDRG